MCVTKRNARSSIINKLMTRKLIITLHLLHNEEMIVIAWIFYNKNVQVFMVQETCIMSHFWFLSRGLGRTISTYLLPDQITG